jgi:hypothetical protein
LGCRDCWTAWAVHQSELFGSYVTPLTHSCAAVIHFPMSENYPVFKQYLEQALQKIEARLGTRVS